MYPVTIQTSRVPFPAERVRPLTRANESRFGNIDRYALHKNSRDQGTKGSAAERLYRLLWIPVAEVLSSRLAR
jgi:hypothetical protein